MPAEIEPIVSLLDQLGYSPINTGSDQIISEAIKQSLPHILGEDGMKALLSSICSSHKLSEDQVVSDYSRFEDAVRSMSNTLADILADEIRTQMWHCAKIKHSGSTLNRYMTEIEYKSAGSKYPGSDFGLTIEEIVRHIQMIETFEFVQQVPPTGHVLLLYTSNSSLDRILSEFLDPEASDDAPKGLISVFPTDIVKVRNLLYDEIARLKGDPKALTNHISEWISKLHSQNTTGFATRIAGQDTWFFENGIGQEMISLEKSVGQQLQQSMSFLCTYNISKLKLGKEQLRDLVSSHGYVIIDKPFMVYAGQMNTEQQVVPS